MIDWHFIQNFDWSRTALGPIESWPVSLTSYVSMVVEMPTAAVIFWGPDQIQIYNDGYSEIMGPRHPRYFGAPCRECWPETFPVVHPWMLDVLERGEVKTVERSLYMLTRHGFAEEAYFTFTFSPLRDDRGAIAGILQPVVEVTDAVLAERRSDTLRALQPSAVPDDAATHAAAVLSSKQADVPFSLCYMPSAAGGELSLRAHFGVDGFVGLADRFPRATEVARGVFETGAPLLVDSVEELLGQAHRGAWPEPTCSAYALPVRRSTSGPPSGVIILGISPRLRFDDRYRDFFEALASGLAGNLEAVAAQRAREEALARERMAHREAKLQREQLAALLTQAPTPIVVLRGPESVIELANPHTLQLWGRELADIIDRPLTEALPELHGQEFPELLQAVYRTGVPYVGEAAQARLDRLGDGTLQDVYLSFVYAPLRNLAGQIDGILVIAFDVTEQVRAREQMDGLRVAAEAANRAKDEFLAVLGHELRNPLAPILTAVELLRLRQGEQSSRELAVIERQAAHLVRLIDDLLDVSRITRGVIEMKKHRINLSEAVQDALEMVAPLVQERQHELTVDVPLDLLVEGDRERLAQVFSNLLSNAARYMEPHGHIEVRAEKVGPWIELFVRDTGIGISPELLPRVFDLFVQERQASDRSRGGLGLGLTISRRLVELHGGTIEVYSEGHGTGSEFTVRLPMAASAAEPGSPDTELDADAEVAQAAGRRVLLVDDNRDAVAMLEEWLKQLGHTVRVAYDGTSALDSLADFTPDVALLDIGLPGMDGYQLAHRLRAVDRLRDLPLVALTGYGQKADRQRSRSAGFDVHLVKPIDMQRLRQVLHQLTEPAASAS